MCLKKQGWGLSGGGGAHKREPEQAHLAGEKEDCQLNGGKGLGSIIMEITYPGAFFSPPDHMLLPQRNSAQSGQLLRIRKASISARKKRGLNQSSEFY